MIEMLDHLLEVQPIDPLAADLALLQMHALARRRKVRFQACDHEAVSPKGVEEQGCKTNICVGS